MQTSVSAGLQDAYPTIQRHRLQFPMPTDRRNHRWQPHEPPIQLRLVHPAASTDPLRADDYAAAPVTPR